MSVDGRDESQGDSEGEGPPQVPNQGGRPGLPPGGEHPAAAIPAQGGEPVEGSVPAQRDRREDGSAVPQPLSLPPRRVPPSDADLIERMRSGDDTAYEELYRRHAGAVRRYARTCCRDAHTADDLTAEVFAGMLQAVRGGFGPDHAVRAYLLTSVRRVAATWTKSARREQLVDDFAVFAAQAARSSEVSDDAASLGAFGSGLDLGADVRAMHEAEQSMAMRAFRSLPERWQAVLWHTEVEDESPSEVATLFGLDANGTRVLASRAREGLKQAYLQAHVSATLAGDEECARHADRLGAYARGGLRSRAERGLHKHLEECAKCRLAARQIKDVANGIPAVVPVAVIGWFGAAGYGKVLALLAGSAGAGAAGAAATAGGSGGGAAGAGAAGAAAAGTAGAGGGTAAGAAGSAVTGQGAGAVAGGGSAGGAGSSAGGGGGSALSEGLGAPVKAGIAAGVVAVAAAAVALALVGDDSPAKKPDAKPPASSPVVQPGTPAPEPSSPAKSSEGTGGPEGSAGSESSSPGRPAGQRATTRPAGALPAVAPKRAATSAPASPDTPAPTGTPASPSMPPQTPTATATPVPPPAPAPAVYQWSELDYDVTGDGSGPEMRIDAGSWVWQRHGVSINGERFAHGVTVHARSSVTVDLNRACSSFDALVGVDDLTLGLGKVSFAVYADGVRLWQSGALGGGQPAVPVHVDLAGHRTVRLVVEPHAGLDSVALADWALSSFTCG